MVENSRFDWQRYWVPRDGTIPTWIDGFPLDPEDGWGKASSTKLLTYLQIAHIPCLALLGEPGIGKSDALAQIKIEAASRSRPEFGHQLFLDLRSYSSEERLHRDLFQSRQFSEWVNGTEVLEIILDSLDECLIHNRTVAAMLVDEFRKYPRSRLRLRIACRTGEWPPILSSELPKLWTADGYAAYELAPLLRRNVEEALARHKIPSAVFLEALRRHNATALAHKPLTLAFLLSTWNGHSFPTDPAELYTSGCRKLCSEQNPNRIAFRERSLGSDEALALAERIAAVTILSKRAIICRNDATSNDQLSLNEIAGLDEPTGNGTVAATVENLREVVDGTGLFSGRSNDQMGWSHWSFAEFLAARYLAKRPFSLIQIRSLVMHPSRQFSPIPRVVPQLREMVGWLCLLRPEIIQDVIDGDPDILLRSAIITISPEFRRELVKSLLNQAKAGRLRAFEWFAQRNYMVLSHDGLAEQLRPYIIDREMDVYARVIAFEIAEACSISDLLPEATKVALELQETPRMRAAAARFVLDAGEPKFTVQLKELLALSKAEDPDDDLKGIALRALWPSGLTAGELFEHLSTERVPNRIGAYSSFLRLRLRDTLHVEDIPVALEWAKKQTRDDVLSLAFQEMIAQIIDVACLNLDHAGVLSALGDVLLARLRRHEPPSPSRFGKDEKPAFAIDSTVRRRILDVIIPQLPLAPPPLAYFEVNIRDLIHGDDLAWFVDRVVDAETPDLQRRWFACIREAADFSNLGHIDIIWDGMSRSLFLTAAFRFEFEPCDLYTKEGRKKKAAFLRRKRWMGPQKQNLPKLTEPLGERLKRHLSAAEGGDLDAWWRFTLDLTIRPPVAMYHSQDEYQSDITQLAGWDVLDDLEKGRFLQVAKKYLENADPNNSVWLGKNVFHRPATAGYKAIRLIEKLDLDAFTRLPAIIWEKWAAIVVAYPESDSTVGAEHLARITRQAYSLAPKEIILALKVLTEKDDREHGHIFAIRRMHESWDSFLSDAIFTFIAEISLKPQSLGDLLDELLEHRPEDAKTVIAMLVSLSLNNEENRERTIITASALLASVPSLAWGTVWGLIENDVELGKKIIGKLAVRRDEGHGAKIALRMKENDAAQLYIWICRQFPHAEDPQHEGVHSVGERDSIATFRDGILARLQERGTPEAYTAIELIIRNLPEIPWLKNVRPMAAEAAMKETWQGQDPRVILSLANSSLRRVVESGEQLTNVILESLERLEKKLHGSTPAVVDLWNESDKTPKTENRVSDYVKRHIENDLQNYGIVANREVEIRDGVGASGEVTDILVQAVARKGHERRTISVLIETKGCWNRDLKDAMKDQLRDRYLEKNECRDGIYLVGWFLCTYWSTADYRQDNTPKWSIDKARDTFSRQAIDLSRPNANLKAFVLDATVTRTPTDRPI